MVNLPTLKYITPSEIRVLQGLIRENQWKRSLKGRISGEGTLQGVRLTTSTMLFDSRNCHGLLPGGLGC